jgi:hypothetical protein
VGWLFTQGGGLGGLALGYNLAAPSGRRKGEPACPRRRRGERSVSCRTPLAHCASSRSLQNVNAQGISRTAKLVSGTSVGLFLVLFAFAGVVSRWGSLGGMLVYPVAVIIWIVWVCHLAWILLRRISSSGNKTRSWAMFVGLVLASVIAGRLECEAGRFLRAHEIQRAVDAGLFDDCVTLLHGWPMKESRIYFSDPEYAQLPNSIKMLSPVYITNGSMEDTNLAANIGLCKNGFGGFAEGVRVFRTDQDARSFENQTRGGCQCIAPGVYYWWHPT